MGRTVRPFRLVLEDTIGRWGGYRKALRVRDRGAFDRMMDACRVHSSAGSLAARPNPTEVMLMSVLLEHQKRLEELDRKIERLLKERR